MSDEFIGRAMRLFESGATRHSDEGKLDYEGFLSPLVIKTYAEYLHEHRVQADGKLRASDNWQNGIPRPVYFKSLFRHFMDAWLAHRNILFSEKTRTQTLKVALCAVLFNASGYLHELLKEEFTFKNDQDAFNNDTKGWRQHEQ